MKTTLIFLATALLSPLATQADSAANARTQEWERRYHDQIGGTLIWNDSKDLAITFSNVGADAYHYLFWCIGRMPDGGMQPFAVFSTWSNYMRPELVAIEPHGITIRMQDKAGNGFLHTFNFADQCATLELWRGKINGERLNDLNNIPESIEAFEALQRDMKALQALNPESAHKSL